MASRAFRSSEDETLSEPFLSNTSSGSSSNNSSGKPNQTKGKIKLSKRLRHARSAPVCNECSPKLNKDEHVTMPLIKSRDTSRTILIGAVCFVIYFGLGVACFYAMEENMQRHRTNAIVDALYFCVVTMTTVGYGDIVPDGVREKLLTCIFVFVSFGLVGFLFGSAADFLVEKQEMMLVKALSDSSKDGVSPKFNGSSQVQRVRLKVVIAGAIFLVLFFVGLTVMIEVEGMGFFEAFYLVCVTVTTLGYGDVSFQTTAGRAFAVIWILVSTVNIAQLFLYIAELFTEGRRASLLQWVLTRKTTTSDLEAADMDDDGVVSAGEFVVYKLKEMGKIEEQDVIEILKEFESLDLDESGTLSHYDLRLAENT